MNSSPQCAMLTVLYPAEQERGQAPMSSRSEDRLVCSLGFQQKISEPALPSGAAKTTLPRVVVSARRRTLKSLRLILEHFMPTGAPSAIWGSLSAWQTEDHAVILVREYRAPVQRDQQ
jgi:hypothetical protein